MLDYARQAQSGRMHWSQVAADILYPEHPTDPAEVLANISTAKDASAALEGYNPPHKPYRELKAKLAELPDHGSRDARGQEERREQPRGAGDRHVEGLGEPGQRGADGELGEGQVWEAAMAANKYKISNLTAIVDQNGGVRGNRAR